MKPNKEHTMYPLDVPAEQISESDGEEQITKKPVATRKTLELAYASHGHTSANASNHNHNHHNTGSSGAMMNSASSSNNNNNNNKTNNPPAQAPVSPATYSGLRSKKPKPNPEVILIDDSEEEVEEKEKAGKDSKREKKEKKEIPAAEVEKEKSSLNRTQKIIPPQRQQQLQQQRQQEETEGEGGGRGSSPPTDKSNHNIQQQQAGMRPPNSLSPIILQSQKRAISPPATTSPPTLPRKTVNPPPPQLQQVSPSSSATTSTQPYANQSRFMTRAEEEEMRHARNQKRKLQEAQGAMATSGGSGGGASDSGDSTRPTKTSRISPAISAAKFYAASSGVGRTLKGDVIPAESGSSSEDGSKASPVVVGDGGGERRRINSLGFKRVAEKRTADPEHGDGIKFPNGVVKRTWCQGVPRSGEDISIEEVLQKDGVAMAVLSAFQWNSQWILEKFRLPGTKFVLVMQAKGEDEKSRLTRMFSVLQGVELVFPNMSGQINCMHSKLMLLFHSDYLRIVVPSANLVPYDWGEVGGVMENCVFIIDLPKLDGDPVDESKLTFFAKELVYFCRAKGYPEKVIRALHRIDYSKTEGLAFVHSVGGSHSGDEAWRRTGYPGLGSAVRKLGLGVKGRGLEVDYITSSVGALNKEFLGNMYRAAMGDDGLAELQSRGKKGAAAPSGTGVGAIGKYFFGAVKSTAAAAAAAAAGTSSSSSAAAAAAAIPPTTWEDVKDRFRVYFPSHETVEKSTGGTNAGGTICFQEKWWNAESFPKGILRDCKNSGEGRGGVLLHSKVLFARRPRGVGGSVQGGKGGKGGRGAAAAVAWAYVGSANLSESAWGKLVLDRASQKPKLNVKNWECGVLVPVYERGSAAATAMVVDDSDDDDTASEEEDEDVVAAATKTTTATAPPPPRDPKSFPVWLSSVKEGSGGGGSEEDEEEKGEKKGKETAMVTPDMEVFRGYVPVPMQFPGRKLAGPGRRPWFYADS